MVFYMQYTVSSQHNDDRELSETLRLLFVSSRPTSFALLPDSQLTRSMSMPAGQLPIGSDKGR